MADNLISRRKSWGNGCVSCDTSLVFWFGFWIPVSPLFHPKILLWLLTIWRYIFRVSCQLLEADDVETRSIKSKTVFHGRKTSKNTLEFCFHIKFLHFMSNFLINHSFSQFRINYFKFSYTFLSVSLIFWILFII